MLSNVPSEKTEFLRRTFLRLVSLSNSLAKNSHTCIHAVRKGAQILGSRPDVELGEDIVQAVVMVRDSWQSYPRSMLTYIDDSSSGSALKQKSQFLPSTLQSNGVFKSWRTTFSIAFPIITDLRF